MDIIEVLKSAGVNYISAMQRFHGNQAMYFKHLFKLPEQVLTEEAGTAFAAGDFKAALTAMHTLKGVLGNLSIDGLYEMSNSIVLKLRAEQNKEAEEQFGFDFMPQYADLIEAIKLARSSIPQ